MSFKIRRLNITSVKSGNIEISSDDRIYLIVDVKYLPDTSWNVTFLNQKSQIHVSKYHFYESIIVIDHDL
jgi:hypothetical protein